MHDVLSVVRGVGGWSSPVPMGRLEHICGLGVVASQALFCHLERIGIVGKFYQLFMIGYLLQMTPLTVYWALGLLFMTGHALLVVGCL